MKRILIISHCPLNKENNMGRTIYELFEGYDPNCLAHLYFNNLKPKFDICHNFYQITDKTAFKSFFKRTGVRGNIVNNELVSSAKSDAESFNRRIKSLFDNRSLGRLLRDYLYRMSRLKTSQLYDWVEEFKPDCIFFLPGFYIFSMDFTMALAKKYSIPVFTYFVDDFYCVNDSGWRGFFHHQAYKKHFRKYIAFSTKNFYISHNNIELYQRKFNVNGEVLMVPTPIKTYPKNSYDKNRFVFMGNLSLGRVDSLIDIAKTLARINSAAYIEIHSRFTNKKTVKKLAKYDNIKLCSFVSYDEANLLIANSAVAINCESFKPKNIKRIFCSFSTKIPDILSLKTLMFSYGPKGVASIDYIKENDCGLVATNINELENILSKYFRNEFDIQAIINNGLQTLKKNHSKKNVFDKLWSGF